MTATNPLFSGKADTAQHRSTTTEQMIEGTLTDELIIGICAPIGTLKKGIIEEIQVQLKEKFNYTVVLLKLSDFFGTIPDLKKLGESKEFARRKSKIEAGNQLRKNHSRKTHLVELVINRIFGDRIVNIPLDENGKYRKEDIQSKRVCYIIDSIKLPEESSLLQRIYRDNFYQFSLFTPLKEREELLHKCTNGRMTPGEVEILMQMDEHEENNNDGQNVENAFLNADFFVRIENSTTKEQIGKRVSRYLDLIFDTAINTPLADEEAMYAAQSAATNAACLSRQVGAAITDKKGSILATGWNDVPKFEGGLYNSQDNLKGVDKRCFADGKFCRNDRKKKEISDKLANNLKELIVEHLDKNTINLSSIEIEKLADEMQKLIQNRSPVKALIEFSRSVHAEMHAIITAAQQTGQSMIGGKLYCTTFPCHNCAKHIIAAGISEVYYIEPYKKSLATELHADAITEHEESDNQKVKILLYDGVAPRRYLSLFRMSQQRKQEGVYKEGDRKKAVPKNRITLQALATLEEQAILSLSANH
jgi:deoxycytidylate deaminase